MNTKRSVEKFSEHFLPRLLRRIELATTRMEEFTREKPKDFTAWFFEKVKQNIKDVTSHNRSSITEKTILVVDDTRFIVRNEFGSMTLRGLVELNICDRDMSIVGKGRFSEPETRILNILLIQFLLFSTHCVIISQTKSDLREDSNEMLTYSKILHCKSCCDVGCVGCYPIAHFFKDLERWTILLPPVL
eukprot:CAMPEP_0201539118 /NCGR_PEP_ID=MMETSP0161_2-20130828/69521_1 /ASSEMBLY_ACC=CAM_ASM_000251 /TAXON_ID=180227 /ORGANISM="Neoparamoeba aestuarina, Strain SoJaBio B1-5/56/2" /LENGTH=188 /DNA_ID=CAMNT_0047946321 /DNA_START=454 /DNA_END=1017 /DNA_ORIENTATION=-